MLIIVKKPALAIALGLLASLAVAAPPSASPFSIPATELQSIYRMLGLKKHAGKLIDACDAIVQPTLEVVDLNGDGQPELFVTLAGACYGAAGGELSLFIRNKHGQWEQNLSFPASAYSLLGSKHLGYPDIEIGLPGTCLPVWRWNGTRYDIHKNCRQ